MGMHQDGWVSLAQPKMFINFDWFFLSDTAISCKGKLISDLQFFIGNWIKSSLH